MQEIPGKSGLGAASLSSLSSLLGSGGSISGAGGTNPFFNTPSLLQAQDPYFSLNALQPGSSSAANSMDILQKSMQDGGLSSILNPGDFVTIQDNHEKARIWRLDSKTLLQEYKVNGKDTDGETLYMATSRFTGINNKRYFLKDAIVLVFYFLIFFCKPFD